MSKSCVKYDNLFALPMCKIILDPPTAPPRSFTGSSRRVTVCGARGTVYTTIFADFHVFDRVTLTPDSTRMHKSPGVWSFLSCQYPVASETAVYKFLKFSIVFYEYANLITVQTWFNRNRHICLPEMTITSFGPHTSNPIFVSVSVHLPGPFEINGCFLFVTFGVKKYVKSDWLKNVSRGAPAGCIELRNVRIL